MASLQDAIQANNASRGRLESVLQRLTATDFHLSLGANWTVATALTHLAFWDFRQAEALLHFVKTGEPLEEDHAVNPALELLASGMDGGGAARLALEAANRVDRAVAALSADAFTSLEGGDYAYLIHRSDHRAEHAAQIEAALS